MGRTHLGQVQREVSAIVFWDFHKQLCRWSLRKSLGKRLTVSPGSHFLPGAPPKGSVTSAEQPDPNFAHSPLAFDTPHSRPPAPPGPLPLGRPSWWAVDRGDRGEGLRRRAGAYLGETEAQQPQPGGHHGPGGPERHGGEMLAQTTTFSSETALADLRGAAASWRSEPLPLTPFSCRPQCPASHSYSSRTPGNGPLLPPAPSPRFTHSQLLFPLEVPKTPTTAPQSVPAWPSRIFTTISPQTFTPSYLPS